MRNGLLIPILSYFPSSFSFFFPVPMLVGFFPSFFYVPGAWRNIKNPTQICSEIFAQCLQSPVSFAPPQTFPDFHPLLRFSLRGVVFFSASTTFVSIILGAAMTAFHANNPGQVNRNGRILLLSEANVDLVKVACLIKCINLKSISFNLNIINVNFRGTVINDFFSFL